MNFRSTVICKGLGAVLLVVASNFTFGQNTKPGIVTDRPDQTEAPVLVPKGGLQVETGFMMEKDDNATLKSTNYTYNTTLIKYGINENFELRFISEYLDQKTFDRVESKSQNLKGLSPVALGVKIKIAEERGIWPQAALIGHVNMRTGSEAFKPKYTAADFRFTFAHTVNDKFSLSYNAGAEWDGEGPEASFLYTLALSYAPTSKLGIFIETYSFFPEGERPDHRVDGGFTYKVTNVVQADLSGGIGLNDKAPDYFLSAGLSFRLFK